MENKVSKTNRLIMENVICKCFLERIRERAAQDDFFRKNIPWFLLNPKKITFYWFDEHIAISFEGDKQKKCLNDLVRPDFVHHILFSEHKKSYVFSAISSYDLEKEVHDDLLQAKMSLGIISSKVSRRGFLFPGETFRDLIELGWRIEVFNSTGVIFGFKENAIPKGMYFNFQNVFIFHKGNNDSILTHHLKWLEVIPYCLTFDSHGAVEKILADRTVLEDAVKNAGAEEFFIPKTYEQVKYKAINSFIELWGNKSTKETTITRFLENESHKFILTMHFGALDIISELSCPINNEIGKSIRPDFFVKKTNGVCDIVEFKLPRVTKPIVVGIKNRRRFASWFMTYLAQGQAYRRYFLEPKHRIHIQKSHGLIVEKPIITIVIGRRCDINTSEIRELMLEYSGINLISYDDLVDGVVAQLYH